MRQHGLRGPDSQVSNVGKATPEDDHLRVEQVDDAGEGLAQALERLSELTGVPGRMEAFGGSGQPTLVVDYAHTPDALEKALSALRLHCRGRLTVVFGCGGDRDRGKRPEMGRIAGTYSDLVVVTTDNPRTENPLEIIPGMTAQIDVITGKKTVLDYLLKPILKAKTEALRER